MHFFIPRMRRLFKLPAQRQEDIHDLKPFPVFSDKIACWKGHLKTSLVSQRIDLEVHNLKTLNSCLNQAHGHLCTLLSIGLGPQTSASTADCPHRGIV